MRTWATKLGPAALAMGLAACGREAPPVEEIPAGGGISAATTGTTDSAAALRYVAIEVVDGGIIRGTVRYRDVVPQGRTVSVPEDSATCGASRLVQPVLVGPHGGLADAVVSLVGISQGAALVPASPPTLDQRGCSFTPHVLLTPTGGTVRVLNSDPLTHNVHTAAFDNRSVNRTQPTGMDVIELSFDAPEIVKIKCDLHPWMNAWIVVIDHPYHAITDGTGAFVLSNIPPGSYTLEVWHETLGVRKQTVTVVAGETYDKTIDLAAGN